jgi:hypothetical protein
MAFREVRVFEVREMLRLWLRGEGLRSIARLAGTVACQEQHGPQDRSPLCGNSGRTRSGPRR